MKQPKSARWPPGTRVRLAVEILTRELTQEELVRLAAAILVNELVEAKTDGGRMLGILALLTGKDCDLLRCIEEAAWSWEINTHELLDFPYERLCAMVEAKAPRRAPKRKPRLHTKLGVPNLHGPSATGKDPAKSTGTTRRKNGDR
jgi:hypothetical protein